MSHRSEKRPQQACPYCQKLVRRLVKHINQKHPDVVAHYAQVQ